MRRANKLIENGSFRKWYICKNFIVNIAASYMMKCDYVKNVAEQQKNKSGLRCKISPTRNRAPGLVLFLLLRRENLVFLRTMLKLSQFRAGG